MEKFQINPHFSLECSRYVHYSDFAGDSRQHLAMELLPMESIINTPVLVHVPASAVSVHTPIVLLNAYNEPAVDVVLDANDDVSLVAWLRPGLAVGEELILRMLRNTPSISDGVDSSNQADLFISVLTLGSLTADNAYQGFPGATNLQIKSYHTDQAFSGAQIIVFKWTGTQWMTIAKNVIV